MAKTAAKKKSGGKCTTPAPAPAAAGKKDKKSGGKCSNGK